MESRKNGETVTWERLFKTLNPLSIFNVISINISESTQKGIFISLQLRPKNACQMLIIVDLLWTPCAHPDVYLRSSVLGSLKHLGRGVGRGPTPGVQVTHRRPEVGEPEVRDLDVHPRVQEQVLRLQVSVHHSPRNREVTIRALPGARVTVFDVIPIIKSAEL